MNAFILENYAIEYSYFEHYCHDALLHPVPQIFGNARSSHDLNQLQKSSKEITAPLSKNLNMSTGSFLNTSATQRVKITVVVLQRI